MKNILNISDYKEDNVTNVQNFINHAKHVKKVLNLFDFSRILNKDIRELIVSKIQIIESFDYKEIASLLNLLVSLENDIENSVIYEKIRFENRNIIFKILYPTFLASKLSTDISNLNEDLLFLKKVNDKIASSRKVFFDSNL